MILSWILNSVSKEIAASIIFVESAEEMWKDLKDLFPHSNGPRVYQFKKLISSLTQEDSSVSTYYTKLKGYRDELTNYRPQSQCTCGANKSSVEYHHQVYILQFLKGLNDSFAHIRGTNSSS